MQHTHTEPQTTSDFRELVGRLKKAVADRDKAIILRTYYEAEAYDLEAMPEDLFDEYDHMVSQANDILMG